VLLYHVQLETADVAPLEARIVQGGFHLVARYGYLGRDHRRFEPEVSWDELGRLGVRLRLVELERGAVNVVVMRAKWPTVTVGHVGFSAGTGEREAALLRAGELELRVRGEGFRLFVPAGRRFELELTDHERFRYDEHSRRELSIGSLELACPEPEEAERVATAVLGPDDAARLRFLPGADRPELRAWQLVGEAVSAEDALSALL
jgi:hypothetical protein